MKVERWHLSITLVCLLFGVLFTSNLKTQLSKFNPMAAKNKTLVDVINTQEQKNHELETEITNIREQIETYHTKKTGNTGLEPLKKDLDRLRITSGLTPLKGPGIKISIDDQEKARTEKDPEFYLIHYSSLLYIVNDLRAGGAEAVCINGDRIVSTTDIRCAGNIILVNTHRLAPPYIIEAIGNPQKLEETVRNGEYFSLQESGFPVTLELKDEIILPEYKGSFSFNFAMPMKEGAE